jgi:predicted PurR-regulated permease PerM
VRKVFGEVPYRTFLFSTFVVVVLLTLLTVRILLIPLIAALFVVYLFEPGVLALQRRGLQRDRAFLVLLVLAAVGITSLLMFMPSPLEAESVAETSQTFTWRLMEQIGAIERWIDVKFPMFRSVDFTAHVTARTGALATRLFEELPVLVTSFALNLLLVPFGMAKS